MAESAFPEQFRPQNLRSYITSYRGISSTASVAARAVTKSTATKGAITNPEGRRSPKTIEPWGQSDRDLDSSIIDTILYETNPLTGADSHTCLFPCRQHVDHVGEELVRLDSEHALLLFDADTLHKPATRIVQTLLASDQIRTAVSKVINRNIQAEAKGNGTEPSLAPGRISFGTHRNTVPKISGIKRRREDDASRHTSLTSNHRGPADVFCVFSPEPQGHTIRPESSPGSGPSPGPSHAHTEQPVTVAGSSRQTSAARQSPEQQLPIKQAPRLLYVKEAKAPHKLSTDIIDMAVGAGEKVLDVGMVMERGYSWSNNLQVEECEYWFAAVCAQLYSTMIDNNVRYGVITTGIYYIFVSIDTRDPSILRYDIAKNTLDAHASDLRTSPLIRLVSLTLLALLYHELPASADVVAIKRRQGLEWATGTHSFSSDEQRGKTPATEDYNPSPGQSSSGSSTSHTNRGHIVSAGGSQRPSQVVGRIYSPDTIPASSYPSPPLKTGTAVLGKRQHCKEDTSQSLDRQETESHKPKRPKLEEKTKEYPVSPAPVLPTTPTSSPPSTKPVARYPSIGSRKYCSLACMEAVKNRSKHCTDRLQAEESCPNYTEHNVVSQLTKSQLRRQLRDELVSPTQSGGWSYDWFSIFPEDSYTQMVKIVVKSHGYVLLAKAFQPHDLRNKMYREASMYNRLRHLQGVCVPVCLGYIELPHDRCLWRCDVQFTGLLLLSYAGLGMDDWPRLGSGVGGERGPADLAFARALEVGARSALARIHDAGVLHADLALRNVLVAEATRAGSARNPEFSLKVLLIDFERSRSVSMFRQDARRRARLEEGLDGGPGRTRDADFDEASADEIGDANFAEACAEEMSCCPGAILRWL